MRNWKYCEYWEGEGDWTELNAVKAKDYNDENKGGRVK